MEMNKGIKKLKNVLFLFYRGGQSYDRTLISGSHSELEHDQEECQVLIYNSPPKKAVELVDF